MPPGRHPNSAPRLFQVEVATHQAPPGSTALTDPTQPFFGGRWIGFALAGELHQVRTEVAAREVAVPGGCAHDPERAVDKDVVAGVTGGAVVVDVDGEPDLAGV